MNSPKIRLLTPTEAVESRPALVELLVDAVEGGAAVNFIWPMSRRKAEIWWDSALESHSKGERLILVAESTGLLRGTVQVIFAHQENQPFRAELAKMIVHSSARRQGIGSALLMAAEREARKVGRTLLVLDTQAGGPGENLYQGAGWIKVCEIPQYALNPDGHSYHAASIYYKLL